jgi:multiple sugar transport system substrate-binding protein
LLFASSQAPDVVFINNLYLPVYCNNLEDLSEIIDKKDFFPQSIEAMSINGKIYAVPRDVSNYVFYYNKNIVGKIDSNWSFAEFENIINKTNTKGKWGVSFEPNILLAEPYILTLGMDKGINYYKNLQGKNAPTPSQIGSSTGAQMFLEGKIGLYLSGRWMYPKISQTANFPFGIVPFPGETYSDASGWAISKASKHKQSAKKFIRYLSSDKSTDFFTESGLIVPARQDSAEKIKEKAFLYAISKSVTRKPDKNFNRNRDKLNKQYFGL